MNDPVIKIRFSRAHVVVAFPKKAALNDEFRREFPRARWVPESSGWVLDASAADRVRSWAALAEPLFEQILAAENADYTESELTELKSRLARLQCGLADAKSSYDRAQQAQSAIFMVRDRLAAVAAEVHQADADARRAWQAVNGMISMLVDLDEMRKLAGHMGSCMSKLDKTNWNRSQERVVVARNRLRAAGLRCLAISKLAGANFNRPDRDHPRLLVEADWQDISMIEIDPEDV